MSAESATRGILNQYNVLIYQANEELIPVNSFKRANDRQSTFVWNEIWKGLLSPGTILTNYLLVSALTFKLCPANLKRIVTVLKPFILCINNQTVAPQIGSTTPGH